MNAATKPELTEQELLTRYIIRIEQKRIREAEIVIADWQRGCDHRLAEVKHRRVDYDNTPEFFTDFKCPICDKRWTEEGSK